MKTKAINQLIDKYLEGKTSPEEERQLAIEVNRPNAPEEWKVIAEMLGELTLGEALYDEEMAKRKYHPIRRYIGWGVAVAACLTLWFVLGKLGYLSPRQETESQIAQQPTRVEKPEKKEVPTVLTPATPVVEEQVAYTPPTKRMKRNPRKQHVPVVEDVLPTNATELAANEAVPVVEELPKVSEEELAQVEREYKMWQLKQAILDEKIEMEIATEKLNRRYEEYLLANRNNIEI
ncbi:MAG: hypothetical protein J5616_02300 [Bacteroidaceae bacterium]|nr:hypothetical protein [Bacteroidaceae bacterium]